MVGHWVLACLPPPGTGTPSLTRNFFSVLDESAPCITEKAFCWPWRTARSNTQNYEIQARQPHVLACTSYVHIHKVHEERECGV